MKCPKIRSTDIRALEWVQNTTPDEPIRPAHLRTCTKQMRELEHRIREAERHLKENAGLLHQIMVTDDNTVYIGLLDQLQILANGMAFLQGLRTAYRVLCGSV